MPEQMVGQLPRAASVACERRDLDPFGRPDHRERFCGLLVHGFDGAGLTIGATPNQIFDWIASSNRGKGDPEADDWIIAPTARIEPGYPRGLASLMLYGRLVAA